METCEKAGDEQIVVLKFVSEYPTTVEEFNLRTVPDIEARFSTLVRLSDHTRGIAVPVAAVALGTVVVEKHLNKSLDSPDRVFSLEPQEFSSTVKAIREAEKPLERVRYKLTERQRSRELTRSLFVVKNVKRAKYSREKMSSQ